MPVIFVVRNVSEQIYCCNGCCTGKQSACGSHLYVSAFCAYGNTEHECCGHYCSVPQAWHESFLLFVHRKLFSGCKSNGIFFNTHQARLETVPDVCLYITLLISVFLSFQFLFRYFLPVYGTPCVDYVCQHERDEYADVCHCLKCEFAGAAVGNCERALQVGR